MRGSAPSAASVRSSRSSWCARISRARSAGASIVSPWPPYEMRGSSAAIACSVVEVVAERIGTALGIEADRGRDRREQRVARDEHAVALEREVAVGVARHPVHAPAVDLVARLDERRVPREADEVGEHVAGLDQLVRELRRHAVADEPLRDLLRPVVGAPDALALRVVEPALEHRRAGRAAAACGAADVVRDACA